ncbi:plasmid stability protein [Oxalobacteraceae bacterium GrIS 2.11]
MPDEMHRGLRIRTASHGRGAEAEIFECAVRPEGRIKPGTLLAEIGREAGGIDLEIDRER